MTLAVLAILFMASVAWAWSQVTDPFPERVAAGPCTDTLISAGEDVAPPQVLVSVLNASGRDGLAGSTMQRLARFGFGRGRTGNAPDGTGPLRAQVWASDPKNPAALLVASYLGENVDIVDRPSGYPGITVVVGKRFKRVTKGHPTVIAKKDTYVCTPPLSSEPDDDLAP